MKINQIVSHLWLNSFNFFNDFPLLWEYMQTPSNGLQGPASTVPIYLQFHIILLSPLPTMLQLCWPRPCPVLFHLWALEYTIPTTWSFSPHSSYDQSFPFPKVNWMSFFQKSLFWPPCLKEVLFVTHYVNSSSIFLCGIFIAGNNITGFWFF